ncbi:MAG: NAD-dependent epimerase/dehydratase family protein [Myxococcales bacterium]|nr:NAD-dependent epimerase/dehydratase family protein [Myxococcales bacterium]
MEKTNIAFVVGATGYTGKAVVKALRARGIETYAHVRPDSKALSEHRSHFEAQGAHVDSTPFTEAALLETFNRLKPSVIFALLGTTRSRRATDNDGGDYRAVDYGLTATVLKAAVRAGGQGGCSGNPDRAGGVDVGRGQGAKARQYPEVSQAFATPSSADRRPAGDGSGYQDSPLSRFVYLSAAGVGPNSRVEYVRVRWQMETELRASGLPFTIARPAIITGPDRPEGRPTERLAAGIGDAALGLLGKLGGRDFAERYQSMSGDVLAAGLVRLAYDPEGAGRVVSGPDLRST